MSRPRSSPVPTAAVRVRLPSVHGARLARALLASLCLCATATPRAQAAAPAPAAPAASAPSMGTHGMALFGGADGLFVSHLPMFHRPHDTQVVLQVHLADARRDAALRRELARHPALWTIVPERFELDRLAPDASDPIRSFRADVVRGHFERGGKTESRDATIMIDRVVFDHRIGGAPAPDATRSYRIVDAGAGAHEHFLVRWIAARPGADHIVPFSAAAGTALPVQVDTPAGASLTASRDALQQALREAGVASARVGKTIYLETGDLE